VEPVAGVAAYESVIAGAAGKAPATGASDEIIVERTAVEYVPTIAAKDPGRLAGRIHDIVATMHSNMNAGDRLRPEVEMHRHRGVVIVDMPMRRIVGIAVDFDIVFGLIGTLVMKNFLVVVRHDEGAAGKAGGIVIFV